MKELFSATAQSSANAADKNGIFNSESSADEHFMALALKLAEKGINTTHPNPAVGCIIVKDNRIVGEGWHQQAGQSHAEIFALNQAGALSKGACMYVTLEPCCHTGKTGPCTKAIIDAGIARMVIATEDPNPAVNHKGISELRAAGIKLSLGVGKPKARCINKGFFTRIETGMPWVTLKIAVSLDGKTAMMSGESQWITSEHARNDSQKMRAACSAIVTGIGTVLADDPRMTVRRPESRQPIRVIIDSNLTTPESAKILDAAGQVIIFYANTKISNHPLAAKKNVELVLCPQKSSGVDLDFVMHTLAKRQINSVLVEAGEKLSGNMLRAQLVNELVVYMAPDVLGKNAKNMFRIAGLNALDQKIGFEFNECTRIGRDLKLALTPVYQ